MEKACSVVRYQSWTRIPTYLVIFCYGTSVDDSRETSTSNSNFKKNLFIVKQFK